MIPVHDEERDLERRCAPLHRYLSERFAHSWAITVADNASTDGTWAIALRLASELDHVRRAAPRREGPGPCAPHRLVGEPRRRRRLHGRRPVDRPRRAAPARRAAALRPQRRRHRHPARVERPCRARPEARADLARLQPAAPHDAPRRVLRRAVRVQGDPRRRRPCAAPAGRGPGLVLRHRAARARRAQRAAHPRGAGRLGRRPRLARRHRAHRGRRPPRRLAHDPSIRARRR